MAGGLHSLLGPDPMAGAPMTGAPMTGTPTPIPLFSTGSASHSPYLHAAAP